MAAISTEGIIQNMPITVRWAGWESNTLTLRRCGWDVSVRQDMGNISFHGTWRIGVALRLRKDSQQFFMVGQMDLDQLTLSMVELYNTLKHCYIAVGMAGHEIHVIDHNYYEGFRPTDAIPFLLDGQRMYQPTPERRSISGFNIFRIFPKEAGGEPEIVIPEKNVQEMLKDILKLQDPKQKEIREKKRREFERMLRQQGMDDVSIVNDARVVAKVVTV